MAPPSATTTETNGTSHPSAEQHAQVKMPNRPGPPEFTDKYEEREYLKGRLAAAFRIFGKYGFEEGVADHMTLRDPVDRTMFWVNPVGVAFSLIKKSDLILIDRKGNILDGGPVRLLDAAAFMIHSAIYEARPDVLCAVHSHSIYGRTFCSLGRELEIITQDSCTFYKDHVLYDSFSGIVLAEEEGKAIAACLGDKKAALLQNHGLLTVGQTIEAAVFWFIRLEKSCATQLMADAAASGREHWAAVKLTDEDAAYTYQTIGTPIAGFFSAKPIFDVIERECGADYLQ